MLVFISQVTHGFVWNLISLHLHRWKISCISIFWNCGCHRCPTLSFFHISRDKKEVRSCAENEWKCSSYRLPRKYFGKVVGVVHDLEVVVGQSVWPASQGDYELVIQAHWQSVSPRLDCWIKFYILVTMFSYSRVTTDSGLRECLNQEGSYGGLILRMDLYQFWKF